jgi:hypothetical protein
MCNDLQAARSKACEIASDVVNGSVRPLLGARMLIGYLHRLENEIDRDVYLLVLGVDSESDALPIGPERQYWTPDALADKDRKADEYEAKVRVDILEAATYIMKRFGSDRSFHP